MTRPSVSPFPRSRSALTSAALAACLVVGSWASGVSTAEASERRHRDDRFRAYGRVIDVRPVYREVAIREPTRECRQLERRLERPFGHDRYERRPHRRTHRHDAHLGGGLVGGVIGGAIGNRLIRHGDRRDRAAATVAGAVIGATIGSSVHAGDRYHRDDRRHRYGHDHRRPARERCFDSVTTRYERRIAHYDVTYVFRGRTFHAQRTRDPGSRIEIDVSVSPSRR